MTDKNQKNTAEGSPEQEERETRRRAEQRERTRKARAERAQRREQSAARHAAEDQASQKRSGQNSRAAGENQASQTSSGTDNRIQTNSGTDNRIQNRSTGKDQASQKRSGTDNGTQKRSSERDQAAQKRRAEREARISRRAEERRRKERRQKRETIRRQRRRLETGYLFRILRMLSMIVIFVCVFLALTMFFRVKNVAVDGGWVYTPEQIREAAGVADGDNLFFLNKYAMRDRILAKLTYVESVRIYRELPDTLHVEVRECRTPFAIMQDGGAWVLNSEGKLIDRAGEDVPWAEITGVRLLSPSLGEKIVLDTDLAYKEESLLSLLAALRNADLTKRVEGIHLEEAAVMRMDYEERFSVRLPYRADYPKKLRALSLLLADPKIQENMTGVIDLTRDEANYFQPDE